MVIPTKFKETIMYFSKIIKTGERQREFNFRKLSGATETSYSVDVPDDRGNRVMFHMFKNEEGRWKTAVETLPPWVYHAEVALSEAIEENRSLKPVKK
jgi:hypothetical protein